MGLHGFLKHADGEGRTAAGLAGAGHGVVLTATGPVAGAHVVA